MSTVALSLTEIRKWFRIRYPLLMLSFIVVSIVIPFYLPYYKDFNPVYSINSGGNYGHSILAEELSSSYEIEEIWRSLNDIDFGPQDALIIITPQIQFSQSEVRRIMDLVYDQGVPVLIFGNSEQILAQFRIGMNFVQARVLRWAIASPRSVMGVRKVSQLVVSTSILIYL
jgi:hypothetical protein